VFRISTRRNSPPISSPSALNEIRRGSRSFTTSQKTPRAISSSSSATVSPLLLLLLLHDFFAALKNFGINRTPAPSRKRLSPQCPRAFPRSNGTRRPRFQRCVSSSSGPSTPSDRATLLAVPNGRIASGVLVP
jgi:hypothetical protein